MSKVESYVTEGVLLAFVTITAYYMYLIYEQTALSTYGVTGAGLVPLQLTAILPIIALTLTLGAVLSLMFWAAYSASTQAMNKRKLPHRHPTRMLLRYACMAIPALPLIVLLWIISFKLVLLYAAVIVAEVLLLNVIDRKVPIHKLEQIELIGWSRVAKKVKSYSNVMVIVAIVVSLCFYAGSIGALTARNQHEFDVIQREGKEWIVLRVYEDKIVSVEVQSNRIMPTHMIYYIETGESVSMERKTYRNLDFSLVSETDEMNRKLF